MWYSDQTLEIKMLNSLPRHTLHDPDHILAIAKNKLPGPPKDSTRTRAHDWKHKAQHTLELHEHGNNIAVAKAYCLTPKLNSPFYANATIHSWSQWPLPSNALQMHHHFTNSKYILACHPEHSTCLQLTPCDRCNDSACYFKYFCSNSLFIFSSMLHYGNVTFWGCLVYVRVSFRVKWDT